MYERNLKLYWTLKGRNRFEIKEKRELHQIVKSVVERTKNFKPIRELPINVIRSKCIKESNLHNVNCLKVSTSHINGKLFELCRRDVVLWDALSV